MSEWKDWMKWSTGERILPRGTPQHSEKILSHCYYVYNKSHTD